MLSHVNVSGFIDQEFIFLVQLNPELCDFVLVLSDQCLLVHVFVQHGHVFYVFGSVGEFQR